MTFGMCFEFAYITCALYYIAQGLLEFCTAFLA